MDAERMAALYARSASSSQSTWREGTPPREPMGRVAERGNYCVASSGASVDVKDKAAPLYWRLAQVRRDSEAHSSSNGNNSNNSSSSSGGGAHDMSGFRSSYGSESPSPIRVLRPLPARSRGKVSPGEWVGADLCADVAAEQYYCAEYGEEDAVQEPRHLAYKRRGAATGREGPRQSPSANFFTRGSQGKLVGRPLARSAVRLSAKQAGPRSSAGGAAPNRSVLCYSLRAPTPCEAAAERNSRRLYFCQDSSVCTSGAGSVHAVPQRVKAHSGVKAGPRREKTHTRAFGDGGPPTQPRRTPASLALQGTSTGQSPNESREDRHARFADVYTEAAGHAGAAGTPPPAACKSAAVANCHPSQDYSVGQGSSDDWISPPRCHEPSRALGPSLPPPPPAAEAPAATLLFSSDSPVAARPSLSCSRQEAEKDAGLPCTGRHYSPNDAVQLRR
ncbi:uncharacterized protein Tco025E_08289, partial [Trypanosoma conorhini]